MENRKNSLEDYSVGRSSGKGWGGVRFLLGLNIALGLMLMAFEVPVKSSAVHQILPVESTEPPIDVLMSPTTVHKPKTKFKPPPELKRKETIVAGPVVEVENELFKAEPFELQAFDSDAYADVEFDEDTGEEDFVIPQKPSVIYEQAPEFPGGMEAFYKFLIGEIDYPEQATWNAESGKTHVSFVVNLDGSVTDVAIVGKGISHSINREIVRALSLSPDWIPGQVNGKTIPIRYTIPITFKLR